MNYRRVARWCCLATVLAIAALFAFRTYSTYAEDAKPEEAKAAEVAPPERAPEGPTEKAEETKPTEEKKEEPAAGAPLSGVSADEISYAIDNMMLFLAAVLVIFMQAGFALVETGLNASKNAVNIMFKNYMDFCIGALLFFLIGYGLMYPGTDEKAHIIPNWLGFAQVGVPTEGSLPSADAKHPLHPMVDFLFQAAFCATAATIISGAVAGRVKFSSYLIYTVVISGFVYPISGMWHWGKGWVADLGFHDFAGSIVVHAVGGFAGLAGAMALGPRIGKFVNGKVMPMPGHNLPYAALGVFILLIGWYGFNPGSQLAFTGKANTDVVMLIAVNTTLAACTGSIAAMLFSWAAFKKPDLTFALNGGLAGLVGITANCDCVTNMNALIIGAIAGVIVCLGVMLLDKLQIDDPVGAFPVHGMCGLWGGIATGIFGTYEGASLVTQIIGSLAIAGWSLGVSLALFFGLKAIGQLRVNAEEEHAGLDISEHGMYAYPPSLVVETFGGGSAGGSYSMTSGEKAHVAVPTTETA